MIAAIELAMLARLKAVADSGATGFAWRTLATFPEQWEDYLDSDAVIACPAAWVVFAGWNATERVTNDDGSESLFVDASFGVMVADENLRPNEQYQRHGGPDPAREPGSYRLALAVVASLAGSALGLDLVRPLETGPMRPVAATAASGKRRMSRHAVEFTTRFPVAIIGDGNDGDALTALHVNWDVPAFAAPIPVDADPVAGGVQLPDDAHADATDHLIFGDE